MRTEYWKESCYLFHSLESEYKAAHSSKPSMETVMNLSNLYSSIGEHRKALQVFLDSERLWFGDEVKYHRRLARLYECAGMIEEAIKQYELIIEIRGIKDERHTYIRTQRIKKGIIKLGGGCPKPITFPPDCVLLSPK